MTAKFSSGAEALRIVNRMLEDNIAKILVTLTAIFFTLGLYFPLPISSITPAFFLVGLIPLIFWFFKKRSILLRR
jgi:hypothetical protein